MQTTFKIEKDEYLKGLKLGSKSPFVYQIPYYLFIILHSILGITSLLLTILTPSNFIEMFLASFFIVLLFTVFIPAFQKRQFNKYFESSLDIGNDTTISISETDLKLLTGSSSVTREWEQLKGWKEDEKYLLLYASDRTFNVFPKRIFSDMPGSEEIIREKIDKFSIPYKKIPTGAIFISIFLLVITALNIIAIF
jgi:hypothetical protein